MELAEGHHECGCPPRDDAHRRVAEKDRLSLRTFATTTRWVCSGIRSKRGGIPALQPDDLTRLMLIGG